MPNPIILPTPNVFSGAVRDARYYAKNNFLGQRISRNVANYFSLESHELLSKLKALRSPA